MKHWSGDKNPKWTGGIREKVCQHCGKTFVKHRRKAISLFVKQKFCTKKCADKGGLRSVQITETGMVTRAGNIARANTPLGHGQSSAGMGQHAKSAECRVLSYMLTTSSPTRSIPSFDGMSQMASPSATLVTGKFTLVREQTG